MGYMAVFVLYSSLIYQPLIISIMAAKNKTQRQQRTDATPRLVGYARVSTDEQDVALQLEALQQHGCEREWIFVDTASGARTQRPGLDACLDNLQEGDVLLVWRLDRLGRSMPHLVNLVTELRERGIGFRSICDGMIDTTTASGELVFNIFSALAQFERRLIQERTQAGLSAARARGRKGGRKPIAPDEPRVQMAKAMHKDKSVSIMDICQTLRISRATFYRYLTLAPSDTSA
jgi:DNA invertase Pin-like site-specific DNA recombinase